VASGEFEYNFRHNSVGYRDVEHSPTADDGTFRILGLGDSFTYGAGAAYEETWLRRLERGLNAVDSTPVEVIKAGVPRYFPEPERLLLEAEGLAYSPQLVLVGFVANDVMDSYMGMDAIALSPRGNLLSADAASSAPQPGPRRPEPAHVARSSGPRVDPSIPRSPELTQAD
jgi:hypothetical protein